ncbi:MAG: tyrosine-type recombinase/integrase [Deltaproteobacteria bacterium]|nr:tyrosine-type recombinase/integrase [Deltaproteobacteria bacterium]
MKLATLLHEFFDRYLPYIKGTSPHTIKGYRDAFKLFLPFAANHYRIKVASLTLDHLSPELILAFLDDLERDRKNIAKTRNHRLAALKSFTKMIRFMYPEKRELADRILNIPQKRTQKALVGFLYEEEILKVFQAVDLKKKDGLRDYALLHLLYDSGARASEVAMLKLDYLNAQEEILAICGKGNRYRIIRLELKTVQLLQLYIKKYRVTPRPPYRDYLFISQRGEALTRHGIYRVCRKYLEKALPKKRLKNINPVHSFRHSCAVNMLYRGESVSDIQNHLGHDNAQSSTLYLHLDLKRKRQVQGRFVQHMKSVLVDDHKIDELLQSENQGDLMAWLDSL